MTAPAQDSRRALVDLPPQYLTRRMRGWIELQSTLDEAGLVGPGRMVLRAIVMETDRVYFARWPLAESVDVGWLYDAFRTLCERLPSWLALRLGWFGAGRCPSKPPSRTDDGGTRQEKYGNARGHCALPCQLAG
jgi:hypothetical protein